MFLGSTALDVAIGLVFTYLVVSLICSALNEGLEASLKNRSKDLERGICEMLTGTSSKTAARFLNPEPAAGNSPETTDTPRPSDIVQAIYDHPLISGLFKGNYQTAKSRGELPSYIPARNFAQALLDLIRTTTAKGAPLGPLASDPAAAVAQLREAVVAFHPYSPRVSDALVALIDAAGNDGDRARQNIEHWFDSSMDRVSGWYKRRAQYLIFTFGMLIAGVANLDSIAIVKGLSTQAGVRDALVAQASGFAAKQAAATAQQPPSPVQAPATNGDPSEAIRADLSKTVDDLRNLGLPIGWDNKANRPASGVSGWLWGYEWGMKVLGILLTGLAVSLGAPFWFDLLNRFIVVRSTMKPTETSLPNRTANSRAG